MRDPQKVIYLFGPFRLDPRERQLIRDGEVIRLQRKAFDVLLALVRSSGQLVTKDELMMEVWGGSVVEEANLTVHISILRKALSGQKGGGKYIESVPKFGYRFVGEIRQLSEIVNQSAAESLSPATGKSPDDSNGVFDRAVRWLIRGVKARKL
jgi:DNA-binding winged helix-turn-helix (wHTH) protein